MSDEIKCMGVPVACSKLHALNFHSHVQAEADMEIRFGIEKVELKMTFAKFQVP